MYRVFTTRMPGESYRRRLRSLLLYLRRMRVVKYFRNNYSVVVFVLLVLLLGGVDVGLCCCFLLP